MNKTTNYSSSVHWFRRDLRLSDNAALFYALKHSRALHCVFVFDTDILQHLPPKDRRITFIWDCLLALDESLKAHGSRLTVLYGKPLALISAFAASCKANAVFTNHDDEPAAVVRDNAVAARLTAQNTGFFTYKDHVVFERDEVMTATGTAYTVFTPYKNAWHKKLNSNEAKQGENSYFVKAYPVEKYTRNFAQHDFANLEESHSVWPTLAEMGFDETHKIAVPVGVGGETGAQALQAYFSPRLGKYRDLRDFPSVRGTSYLSVHLRFGTISVRQLARDALVYIRENPKELGAMTWLNELAWRDFYMQIMFHRPRAVTGSSFKSEYDQIQWEAGEKAEQLFTAWCEGRTGYPLVDAAMRQINQTGFMHNRLRMVSACFLVKDLGINWRRGEAYFAQHLNDFDLSANNGGWQWASSSGCDAQPYFRIFNPITQSEKFDGEGHFIRKYVPELAALSSKEIHAPWLAEPLMLQAAGISIGNTSNGATYPLPIVDHAEARALTLARFSVVKKTVSEQDLAKYVVPYQNDTL